VRYFTIRRFDGPAGPDKPWHEGGGTQTPVRGRGFGLTRDGPGKLGGVGAISGGDEGGHPAGFEKRHCCFTKTGGESNGGPGGIPVFLPTP